MIFFDMWRLQEIHRQSTEYDQFRNYLLFINKNLSITSQASIWLVDRESRLISK